MVLVLSLFVFRDRFEEGVGSFSNLIGAGGLGVLLGILTVGKLEERLPKERIVARAFFVGGLVLIAVSTYITGWSVLVASFAVGLTFAWKKIPVDTMVQEAIPDGYRGRVFAVYDVAYNLSRVAAAFLAIPLLNAFGEAWAVAIVGVVFILWSPVLPRWIERIPELTLRFYEGARAEEDPGPWCGAASRRRSRSSAARWRRPTGCAGRASACGCWTGRRSRSRRSSPTAPGRSSASSAERGRSQEPSCRTQREPGGRTVASCPTTPPNRSRPRRPTRRPRCPHDRRANAAEPRGSRRTGSSSP